MLALRDLPKKSYRDGLKSLFVHVPKTGGTAIGVDMWPHTLLLNTGHVPLMMTRARFESLDDRACFYRCFKWGFVRNPYDRVLSWFYAKGAKERGLGTDIEWDPKDFEQHRQAFRKWIAPGGAGWIQVNGNTFRPEWLLWHANEGNLVDYIARYENYDDELVHVGHVVGCAPRHLGRRSNVSVKRDGARHLHYSFYYDDFTRGIVTGLGWWELRHLQWYEYEDVYGG